VVSPAESMLIPTERSDEGPLFSFYFLLTDLY